MALRPFQNSSSRLMLVLRPAMTTDRFVTVESMKAPFPSEVLAPQPCGKLRVGVGRAASDGKGRDAKTGEKLVLRARRHTGSTEHSWKFQLVVVSSFIPAAKITLA